MLVGDIIGELELVEGDRFVHPLLASAGRVRVDVEAFGHLRVCLASHQPSAVVEFVATVVHGSDVHQHDVLGLTLQAGHVEFERREHSSVSRGVVRIEIKLLEIC